MKENLSTVEYCVHCILRIVNDLIELTPDDLPEFARDNIANDIANDWEIENFKFYLDELQKAGCNIQKIDSLIQEICNNFEDVSFNGVKYDEKLWYKESFLHSDFWNEQRVRAAILKKYLLLLSEG